MNKLAISLNQFVVLALLGLSVYLKSPIVACAVVLVLAVKEAREAFDGRNKAADTLAMELKVLEMDSKLKSIQNDMNRMVIRQTQYFGE